MLDWTPERVSAWLCDIGLAEHAQRFKDEGISGEVLVGLTAEELKDELGVTKLGERKRLLSRLADVQAASAASAASAPAPAEPAAQAAKPERPPSQAKPEVPLAEISRPKQEPLHEQARRAPAAAPQTVVDGQQLYLLDGRNIACAGGGWDNPSTKQLRLAQEWFAANRPGWTVKTFLYKGLVEQWSQQGKLDDLHCGDSTPERIVTPSREDVDKFIIRRAVDEERKGRRVRIVSNDAFSNYVDHVDDAPDFDQAWVRQHVVKFCFDSDGVFMPCDGFRGPEPPLPPPRQPSGGVAAEAPAQERGGAADGGRGGGGGPAEGEARSMQVEVAGKGAQSVELLTLVDNQTVSAQCPHRRRCHLRVACRAPLRHGASGRGRWRVQLLGVEAPASRAELLQVQLLQARGARARTWCPTCRRPLELRSRLEKGEGPEAPIEDFKPRPRRADRSCGSGHGPGLSRGRPCAFVVVLFGTDEAVVQRCVVDALVLGYSLQAQGTRHDMVLLHTADVLSVPGAALLELFWRLREVDYVEAAGRLTGGSEARFRHVFTKLRALECTEYRKIVLLDSDLLVQDNIDELADFRAPSALRRGHRPRSGAPAPGHAYYDCQGKQRGGVNLGVAVLEPSSEELGKMLKVLASEHDPMHQASRGPDQDFLTRWPAYVDQWGRGELELKYNYQLHQLQHALEHEGPQAPRLQLSLQQVKVLHYSGSTKPRDFWLRAADGVAGDFDGFCEHELVPRYCGSCPDRDVDARERVHATVREAVHMWKASFESMWKDVLARVTDGRECQICGRAHPSDACLRVRALHCFSECGAIQDWEEFHEWRKVRESDGRDLLALEPGTFAGALSFVSTVYERRSWLGPSLDCDVSAVEMAKESEAVALGSAAAPCSDDEKSRPQQPEGSRTSTSCVEQEGAAHWSCPRCGEANRASRARCNNCGDSAPAACPRGGEDLGGDGEQCSRRCDPLPSEKPNDSSHWACPRCGELNRADRQRCNICGDPLPSATPASQSAIAKPAPSEQPVHEDRWECPACGEPNRMDRTQCNNCGKPVAVAQPDQDDRWDCPACGEPNRTDRAQCNNCGKPAPSIEPVHEDHWDCPACGEPNRMDRLRCNNCGGQARVPPQGPVQPPSTTTTEPLPRPVAQPRSTGSVLDQKRTDILAAVSRNRVTIIVAPTGCGKSTGIPQMILDEVGLEEGRRILCTQPRRIAATSLAKRVAEHRGAVLGREVGYQIGGCNEISRSGRTSLIYATTAIAMIQCLQDCATFTHLLVDEVHIRDSFIDFLLTLVVTKVLANNDKVKVVLMSAAMDSDTVSSFFASALGGEVPRPMDLESCRPYPLHVKYLDDLEFFRTRGFSRSLPNRDGSADWTVFGVPADWKQEEVAELHAMFVIHLHATREMRIDKSGARAFESFLVFLPGKREVTLLAEKLEDEHLDNIDVRCIFGGQTVETQEQTLQSNQAGTQRTVILATDVVESSVTIPDVDLVIDTCEHKRLRWDPSKRQSLLTLLLISQDEAKQRAGRTGRVRPGEVMRLLSRSCFDALRPHVEPQIRHSRLEEVLLTIFELPNLGDPREFLLKMPDPPEKLRIDTAITRLLELNALDRTAAVHGGSRARPTHFGRFLQKMPLDPEVGCLVMNGVRHLVADECTILAAVHQRGEPFLDSQDWTPDQVRELRAVRDACSPGRARGRERVLPSDLVAGMRAYQAWQQQVDWSRQGTQQPWPLAEESQWCKQHYLSLDRLHEIEEMVVQIREVLEQLGYGDSVPGHKREQMRRRRQEKLSAKGKELSTWSAAPPPDPAADLRRLLAPKADHDTELLLTWCLAASFTAGIVEVRNGSSTEQVKFRAKKGCAEKVASALVNRGFQVKHVDHRGADRAITFSSPEEAHRCLQEVALCNNRFVPWRNADIWGRPQQRKVERPRKCYEGPSFRIISSSLAQPVPCDDITVVAGEILACMDHKRTSMSYFATKCSVVPRGILPLVLYATYPAVNVERLEFGTVWELTAQIHGQKDTARFQAPSAEVAELLEWIRSNMDTEFGMPQKQREAIARRRRESVLRLVRLLDQRGPAPMPLLKDESEYMDGSSGRGRRRGGPDLFDQASFSFLRNLFDNDLSQFKL